MVNFSPWLHLILLLFPLLGTGIHVLLREEKLNKQETDIQNLMSKSFPAKVLAAKKEAFLNRYSETMPYYLDQEIESLLFLESEKKWLEELATHPATSSKQEIQKRLEEIKENRLSFSEGAIREAGKVRETVEKQRRPIELDEDDLSCLLAQIEDRPVGNFARKAKGPQLIVTQAELRRKGENWELKLELLKREFL